jgi:DNA polymerase-3 subunit delta'
VRWFDTVRGHSRAKDVLARAVERGRVPPALLITGREGTGRALLARELAKALNCRGDGSAAAAARPCGQCLPCRKIEAGTHADYVVVSPEEGKAALPIDRVREVLEELSLAPVEAQRRVFVFDPADAMLDDAQNALLKALEEPPGRAHLILIAGHEDALLRTIASRCFVLALGELTPDEVQAILEARGVPEAKERAAWSGGSPGVALREHHLEVVAAARALLEAWASGAARRDPLGVAAAAMAAVAPKGAEAKERREGALEVTDLVGRALRDALDRATRGAGASRLSGAEPALLERLAAAGPEPLARAIEAVVAIDEAIEANQNMNLSLEGLVLDVVGALGAGALRSGKGVGLAHG